MKYIHPLKHMPDEQRGLWYGFIGVMAFSLTLPATRVAVGSLDPLFVGVGRPAFASLLAMVVVLVTRMPFPKREHIAGIALVALGISIGFPILAALAMKQVPSSHGAVMLGLLPLATAITAAWRASERPSRIFWLASIVGSSTIVGFALYNGAGSIQMGDVLLLGALIFGSLGYAEGGRLSRVMSGWHVITWALVLGGPLTLVLTIFIALQHPIDAPPTAWMSFGYIVVISQFLGFLPWYRGMALSGVARVGQVQLLQPFLTFAASAWLLGEEITLLTVLSALIVCGAVWIGRKAPITRPSLPSDTTLSLDPMEELQSETEQQTLYPNPT